MRCMSVHDHSQQGRCALLITDASMTIGAGGINSDLHITHREERDIQWRELIAIYGALFGLNDRYGADIDDSFIHIFTDNSACKFMLINLTAILARPDLQILLNNICELCVNRLIHLWLDHIPGDNNTIADALSRFYPNLLAFPQLDRYNVGDLHTDRSHAIKLRLQHGADAAARFLYERNQIIRRQDQEFPSDSQQGVIP